MMKTTVEDIRRDIARQKELMPAEYAGQAFNAHIDYPDCFVYYDQNGFSVTERRKPGQPDEELFHYSEKWPDPEAETDA